MTEHHLIPLDEQPSKPTDWLWPDRIPLGGTTVCDGDPGSNKSTMLYDVTARVTTGRPMPFCTQGLAPASAILLQAEDTSDTMKANLKAAGAALDKVLIPERSATGTPLTLPQDFEFLANAVLTSQSRLVVIDPISAFFGVNLHNDQAVRRAVQPLMALAEQASVAIVLVRHLTKSGGGNPLYRGAGSMGLIGAARAGLLVAPDPGDPNQRVLAQSKRNLTAPAESLSFRPMDKGGGITIEWLGPCDYSAAQLLEAAHAQSRPELEEAIFVLYSILADGPVPADHVKQLATRAGVAPRTLRRAKDVLQVVSRRKGYGTGGRFFWVLPPDQRIAARLRKQDVDRLMNQLCHGPTSADGDWEDAVSRDRGTRAERDQRPDDGESGMSPSSVGP